MPISVKWDDTEKTILRVDYTEPVRSWEEYQDAVNESYMMATSVPHPVINLQNPGKVNMPKGSPFPHVQRALRIAPPNVVWVIMVVENTFARAILPLMMRQLVHPKVILVRSLADAQAVIAEKLRLLSSSESS